MKGTKADQVERRETVSEPLETDTTRALGDLENALDDARSELTGQPGLTEIVNNINKLQDLVDMELALRLTPPAP
jgi:hypothetical protein